jgi:hypothetical protein
MLKDFDIAMLVTGCLWPNSEVLGWRSILLEDEHDTPQTDMTQSTPAVTRTRESANATHEICP